MQTYQVGLIGIFVAAPLVAISISSWFRRGSRQEQAIALPTPLEELSGSAFDCFYVATTFSSRPLDRISAHGLGMRGRAQLLMGLDSLGVSRVGERSFQINYSNVLGVSSSAAVIDRAVETDGLTVVRWKLGQEELETYLRFVNQSERRQFIDLLDQKFAVSK